MAAFRYIAKKKRCETETDKSRIIYVPEDLVFDVLWRLPVKSLTRFRSNSKEKEKDIKEVNLPTHLEYDVDFINRGTPEIDFESSINGVLFMRYQHGEETKIAIWNPLSQRHQEILYRDLCCCPELLTRITFGFGYEKTTNDYKVVALLNCYYDGETDVLVPGHCHGWIYSLKLNTWKRLENFSYTLNLCESSGVFWSGALHWITQLQEDGSFMILRFDLVDEKFDLVRQPPNIEAKILSVLGCLCLSRISNLLDGGIEIWMMNKDKDKDCWSWSMMINLVDHNFQTILYRCYNVELVAYLAKRQVLILNIQARGDNREMLISYDLVHSSIHTIHVADIAKPYKFTCVTALPYTETLECYPSSSDSYT